MKKVCLYCEQCIEAINSHDRVYVGEMVSSWGEEDSLICEWCDEETDTLYECKW